MTVSVCMICRNEEATLPTALASVQGLADEVVIVDTGSTDATVAVARAAGATVIEGGDRRHKAAERNHAADASTGDWIVVLDADERVADPAGVRALLDTTPARAVYIKLAYMDGDGKETLSYAQMRCWRRGTYRYHYRAHEVPLPVDGNYGNVERTAFVWEHRPPEGRAWKADHYLMLLLMDDEEHPDDPRIKYYLSRQWMYVGAYRKCIEVTERFLALTMQGDRDRADAYGNMAQCYVALGKRQLARDALWGAVREEPGRREWWGCLAEMYHDDKRFDLAAGLLTTLLALDGTGYYRNEWWHGYYPHDLLARCLWQLGRYDEGRRHAERACELSDLEYLRRNLRWFEDRVAA